MKENDMTNKEYNGWYNYETWLVNLWIDNEQGSQEYWQDRAIEAYRQVSRSSDNRAADAAVDLADQLKDSFEEQAGELTGVTGFWSDLLNGALSEVNWREIAEHMVEDVDKEQFVIN